MLRFCCAIVALATLGAAPAPRLPRVVSLNPCVDAMLLQIADRSQVLAISHFSHDPRATSVPLALARSFRTTSGTAEEVIALRPNIVLAGTDITPSTIAALHRLGMKVAVFRGPESVRESLAQVRQIGDLVGKPARSAALAARIEAAARPMPRADIPALIWRSGGLVPGANTLPDDLLRRAGFRNLSASYGLTQWDILPLEYLLSNPPRLLLAPTDSGTDEEQPHTHRALGRLSQHIATRPYDSRLMNCGGPTIIAAMARLHEIRRSLPR